MKGKKNYIAYQYYIDYLTLYKMSLLESAALICIPSNYIEYILYRSL